MEPEDSRPLPSSDPHSHGFKTLRIALGIGFATSVALTSTLWTSARLYPPAPILSIFPAIYSSVDTMVFTLFISAIIFAAFSRGRTVSYALVVGLGTFLCSQDQNRLHPWVYEYLLLHAILALHFLNGDRRSSETTANRMRTLVFLLYFWSGLQKITPGFFTDVFPWILLGAGFDRIAFGGAAYPLGICAAITEASLAILLIVPRLRRIGVIGLIAMHGFILVAIGPWGHRYNLSVWPWNIAMSTLLVVLFWDRTITKFFELVRRDKILTLVCTFCGIFPLFGYFGYWDVYLSFGMYNGNISNGTVVITPEVRNKLPNLLQKIAEERSEKSYFTFTFTTWSLTELGTPPVPEVRLFKVAAESLCTYSEHRLDTLFHLEERGIPFVTKPRENYYTCNDQKLEELSGAEIKSAME